MLIKHKKLLTYGLPVAIILILVLAVKVVMSGKHMPRQGTPSVVVTPVKQQTWQQSLQASGIIQAKNAITIKTETAGRVRAVSFRSGQKVKAGAVLVQLGDTTQKGQVAYDQAQVNLSKYKYERDKALLKSASVSKQDYDEAYYTYQSNLGQLEQAQSALDKTTIRAPFNGKLGISNLAKGAYLTQGAEIVSLQQLDPLYVNFSIPERYVGKVHLNDKVKVYSNAYPKQSFDAHISAIDGNIDQDTGTLMLQASFANKDEKLLPGNFVTIKLFLGQASQVLTVPETAVEYSEKTPYVYRYQDNKAVQTPVSLGRQVGNSLIVTKGLNTQDTIISVGASKVSDGKPVNISKQS